MRLPGCTNSEAKNFNAKANQDDGTCNLEDAAKDGDDVVTTPLTKEECEEKGLTEGCDTTLTFEEQPAGDEGDCPPGTPECGFYYYYYYVSLPPSLFLSLCF